MGAVAHSEVVAAVVHDVGLGVFAVVALELFLGDVHGQGLALAGGEHVGLGVAHQLHSGLFDAVQDVVLGVGLLQVDGHDLFAAVLVAHVGDGDGHVVALAVLILLEAETGIGKLGVGQTVAKGEGHILIVIVIAGVGTADDAVVVAGLVVAVTDVDALGVHAVVHVGFLQARFLVAVIGLGKALGSLLAGVVEGQLHSRRRGEIILGVGVGQLAGGHIVAHQGLGHRMDARAAHIAHPGTGVHVDDVGGAAGGGQTIQEVQLHGGRGVQQHDDLLDLTLLFQFRQARQHGQFVLAQGEVAAVMAVSTEGGHVAALARAAGHHADGGGALQGSLDVVAHRAEGRVVDELGVTHGDGGIVIPGILVDDEARLLQRFLEGGVARGGGAAGAGGGVVEVVGAAQHGADLLPLLQGQGAVLVAQQHQAFAFHFLSQGIEGGLHVLVIAHIGAVLVVAAEVVILRVLRIGNAGGIDAEHGIDRAALAHGDLIAADQQHQHSGDDQRQRAPKLSLEDFLHLTSPLHLSPRDATRSAPRPAPRRPRPTAGRQTSPQTRGSKDCTDPRRWRRPRRQRT